MKTFVFFIGGTGARVLRSLTMLMASGVSLKDEQDAIVPIIVDFDATNADLKRSNELMGQYNNLHSVCDYAKDKFEGKGFFKAPLGIEENGMFKQFGSLVKMSFSDDRSTFGKYIGYDSLGQITRETAATKMLIDSLYDDSSESSRDRELNLELKYGFKGNPNIGSVVFNEYFKSAQFQEFKDNFNPGDRIFIVASIFGGTGSSGLPQLVKKIREDVTSKLQDDGTVKDIREAMLGTCIVMPYFKVKDKADSAINSLTFKSKAKAALGYYYDEINSDISEVYYIGCDQQNVGYENIEGGDKQENKAHIVELLSAMSIIEFANRKKAEIGSPTKYYEYTTTSATDSLPNPSFLDILARPGESEVYQKYIKKLNALALLLKFFEDDTRNQCSRGFFSGGKDSYYKNLEDYLAPGKDFSEKMHSFAQSFKCWANELSSNSIYSFYPYNFDAKNLHELVKIDASNQYKDKKLNDTIVRALNNECVKENKKDSDGGKTFLRHAYTASMEAASKLGQE